MFRIALMMFSLLTRQDEMMTVRYVISIPAEKATIRVSGENEKLAMIADEEFAPEPLPITFEPNTYIMTNAIPIPEIVPTDEDKSE